MGKNLKGDEACGGVSSPSEFSDCFFYFSEMGEFFGGEGGNSLKKKIGGGIFLYKQGEKSWNASR